MIICNLRVRFKAAIDLRFRVATPSPMSIFPGIYGDLAPTARKSLAIAIVRFVYVNVMLISAVLSW